MLTNFIISYFTCTAKAELLILPAFSGHPFDSKRKIKGVFFNYNF